MSLGLELRLLLTLRAQFSFCLKLLLPVLSSCGVSGLSHETWIVLFILEDDLHRVLVLVWVSHKSLRSRIYVEVDLPRQNFVVILLGPRGAVLSDIRHYFFL